MKKLLILLPTVALLFGCASTGQQDLTPEQQTANNIAEVSYWAYSAAQMGTVYAITKDPSLRPKFEQAVIALDGVASTNVIDPLVFRKVLQSLPVKELKSPEAVLAVTTATLIYQRYTKGQAIDQPAYLNAAASSVRDGIRDGLAMMQ